jgi:AcrR family transcriptional regulator
MKPSLQESETPGRVRAPAPKLGLRERKKARTRAAIREHAMRLFREQGYDQTTIEQIAEAAEVAQSTVFRYFPTKEDLVMLDDYDAPILAALRSAPAGLSPIAAMRAAYRSVFDRMTPEEKAGEWERGRLIMSVPDLRGRALSEFVRSLEETKDVVAERTGLDRDDPRIRNLAGAVIGVGIAAMLALADDPDVDLYEELDKALAHLEAGLPL